MTQLIINGVALPETSNDKYQCPREPLGRNLEMISGRMVIEARGKVYQITYSYDYMGDALMRPLLEALRSGGVLDVQFLPDNSAEMQRGKFLVTSLTNPTFAFSKNGKAYWHNIAFTLREVKPSD